MTGTPGDRRPIRGLRGRRVYLRPVEPEDADTVSAWYDDSRVATLMGELPLSHASRRARYARTDPEDDVFRFVICRIEDDVPVGRTDLFDLDRANGSCALGIAIGDPADWGRGYGSDALSALVDFGFGQLRLERIWLDTEAGNQRAQAAYRKAGFETEGRLRRAWFQDGAWQDDLRMALLRERWLELDRPRSWDLVADEIDATAKPVGS